MLFRLLVSFFACSVLAFDASIIDDLDKFPSLCYNCTLTECTPELAFQAAILNTQSFIEYATGGNFIELVVVYGSVPTAFVDPNFCFTPGCCTRIMDVGSYVVELYARHNVNVAFLFNGAKSVTINPDGTYKVTATEITYLDNIISVRPVFWIWQLVNDAPCGEGSGCNMELVQFQSTDFTCQFGAPLCGDCYVGGK